MPGCPGGSICGCLRRIAGDGSISGRKRIYSGPGSFYDRDLLYIADKTVLGMGTIFLCKSFIDTRIGGNLFPRRLMLLKIVHLPEEFVGCGLLTDCRLVGNTTN